VSRPIFEFKEWYGTRNQRFCFFVLLLVMEASGQISVRFQCGGVCRAKGLFKAFESSVIQLFGSPKVALVVYSKSKICFAIKCLVMYSSQ
jgi:hypothetical protein